MTAPTEVSVFLDGDCQLPPALRIDEVSVRGRPEPFGFAQLLRDATDRIDNGQDVDDVPRGTVGQAERVTLTFRRSRVFSSRLRNPRRWIDGMSSYAKTFVHMGC